MYGAGGWDKHDQLEAKRGEGGRFLPGVPGGPGRNPLAEKRKSFQKLITECTSDEDLREVWATLFKQAKEGQPWAIKEVLDRCLGKATVSVELESDAMTSFVKIIKGVDPDAI